MEEPAYFPTREAWRAWLEAHHAEESLLWFIFYKKHTGQPSVSDDAAVEEALCFGWIDSIVRKIDADRYMQKFTPRKAGSDWSESNKVRVRRLVAEGRMSPAGMLHVQFDLAEPAVPPPARSQTRPVDFPPDLEPILRDNVQAWQHFQALAPSHRRNYVGWVTEARKLETRERRLREAILKLERGEPLGMK